MDDDRLAHLLSHAADLEPSDALRRRVAASTPASGAIPAPRRRGWRLGLALSGGLGAALVLGAALLPRESSAESLLHRASESQARIRARFRTESFAGGRWTPLSRGMIAPGWTRWENEEGTLTLQTPQGRFHRERAGNSVLRVPEDETLPDQEPRLASRLKLMTRFGWDPVIAKKDSRREGDRDLQDVTILLRAIHERETFTLDAATDLPVAMLQERNVGGRWIPSMRTTFDVAGPEPGANEFWAGIDRRRIVDSAQLVRSWALRLASVRERLSLPGGEALDVHDLRTLPSGDVLLLYTGPVDLNARLVGEDGTVFVRVPFSPNEGHMIPRLRPTLKIGGEIVRGLWFAPETEGERARGAVRLEVLAPNGSPRGRFALDPDREDAAVPAWAEAIDFQRLALNAHGCADEARMVAAYDVWIDDEGRSVPGTRRWNPRSGIWIDETAPGPGLRRDPAAAARAAVAFRRLVAHAEAEGNPINPELISGYLGRFDREAGTRLVP